MDIIVKARHTELDPAFRAAVTEKLSRLAKLDARADRIDVVVAEERNPRQSNMRIRLEITCHTRRPVVRAEAAAADHYAALDLALGKLDMRLRRAADRRRVHHGTRTPASLATAISQPPEAIVEAGEEIADDPPFIVREKDHHAAPMSLEQALFEMELVGHDFFLYVDADHGTPSVVYRRRGYDYGVLRLRSAPNATA